MTASPGKYPESSFNDFRMLLVESDRYGVPHEFSLSLFLTGAEL